MEIQDWWHNLSAPTRTWLLDNAGDAVPHELIAEITAAGGPPISDEWWTGQIDGEGFHFPDEATDWIEAVANDEHPEVL